MSHSLILLQVRQRGLLQISPNDSLNFVQNEKRQNKSRFEANFLITQNLKPWLWLRYSDDIFLVWTHGEEKLHDFISCLNEFNPNLKFTYEYSTD